MFWFFLMLLGIFVIGIEVMVVCKLFSYNKLSELSYEDYRKAMKYGLTGITSAFLWMILLYLSILLGLFP
jgi:hypothetical protein